MKKQIYIISGCIIGILFILHCWRAIKLYNDYKKLNPNANYCEKKMAAIESFWYPKTMRVMNNVLLRIKYGQIRYKNQVVNEYIYHNIDVVRITDNLNRCRFEYEED